LGLRDHLARKNREARTGDIARQTLGVLPGYQGFDSMAADEHGSICVATLKSGSITVIAAGGEVLRQVPVPDTHVTNICFGGPDRRTAYSALAGRGELASMRWPEKGLALNFSLRVGAKFTAQLEIPR
jgi:gluconolactonase